MWMSKAGNARVSPAGASTFSFVILLLFSTADSFQVHFLFPKWFAGYGIDPSKPDGVFEHKLLSPDDPDSEKVPWARHPDYFKSIVVFTFFIECYDISCNMYLYFMPYNTPILDFWYMLFNTFNLVLWLGNQTAGMFSLSKYVYFIRACDFWTDIPVRLAFKVVANAVLLYRCCPGVLKCFPVIAWAASRLWC
jgi:hypothetical protein